MDAASLHAEISLSWLKTQEWLADSSQYLGLPLEAQKLVPRAKCNLSFQPRSIAAVNMRPPHAPLSRPPPRSRASPQSLQSHVLTCRYPSGRSRSSALAWVYVCVVSRQVFSRRISLSQVWCRACVGNYDMQCSRVSWLGGRRLVV
jgi:hypothetical protein